MKKHCDSLHYLALLLPLPTVKQGDSGIRPTRRLDVRGEWGEEALRLQSPSGLQPQASHHGNRRGLNAAVKLEDDVVPRAYAKRPLTLGELLERTPVDLKSDLLRGETSQGRSFAAIRLFMGTCTRGSQIVNRDSIGLQAPIRDQGQASELLHGAQTQILFVLHLLEFAGGEVRINPLLYTRGAPPLIENE